MKSKYLDKVYDGMWKVIKLEYRNTHEYYTLENIYNHNKIEIVGETMKKLSEGKTTVSNIISSRIKRSERTLVY